MNGLLQEIGFVHDELAAGGNAIAD
jgi:hypothetical protein